MSGKFVLICDDEVHITRVIEIKFRRAGFDVATARDGQQAWEMIQARCPDLLITDCSMPKLDGFELCDRLRGDPQTQSLPIVMLTAKGYEVSPREVADKWGVVALVTKPFSPRELLGIASTVLEDVECPTEEAAIQQPEGR